MKGKGGKIAILLGMKPGEGGDDEEEAPSSSKMEGPSPDKVKMFRKMRKAFEMGDDEAGAEAFEALVSMCGGYDEED